MTMNTDLQQFILKYGRAVAGSIADAAKQVGRLLDEEALDKALCTDALDLPDAALCGDVSPKLEPPLTPAATSPAPQQPQAPLPNGLEYSVKDNGESVTITRYTGSADSIDIPACIQGLPVTAIGEGAFDGCWLLTSISIPSSVTTIEKRAFGSCYDLTSISIPSSVTTIGEEAFSDCSGLTSISIPSSVTTIGKEAFSGCSSLTSISIPSSVTAIGEEAFANSSLTSIQVDAGNSAFTSVDGILFDRAMQTIVACPGGREGSYTIPSSVTAIGGNAFYHCSGLTSISIPSSVTAIGEKAFGECTSLTSISIPSSVTAIGEDAFYRCTSLTSISIPSSVTTIRKGAFYHCTSLTSISIPSSVTAIESLAFDGCSRLTSISIPSSVTTIGVMVFFGCCNLTSIQVDVGNSAFTSVDGILFDRTMQTLVVCPEGRKGSYTIPSSVTTIGKNAFFGCWKLTSISIPSSVTTIGKNAFFGCSGLRSVTLSRRTQVGEDAFPDEAKINYRD